MGGFSYNVYDAICTLFGSLSKCIQAWTRTIVVATIVKARLSKARAIPPNTGRQQIRIDCSRKLWVLIRNGNSLKLEVAYPTGLNMAIRGSSNGR